MNDRLDPLTPEGCDLTGLDYMPLFCARIIDSDLMALSTGDEFKAAFRLWCKAWTQPGASLPNDDRILASYANVSREFFAASREVVMRGWIECADGRLYHPTVSEAANMAWSARVQYEQRTGKFSEKQALRARSGWIKRRAQAAQNATADATASKIPATADATAQKTDAALAMPMKGKGKGIEESTTLVGFSNPTPVENSGMSFAERAEMRAKPAAPSKPKAARSGGCVAFDAAWKAWPQKTRSAKAKSLALWVKHVAAPEAKLGAVKLYLASKDARKDGGAFVPAFERWIRDRLDSHVEALSGSQFSQAPERSTELPSSPDWWRDAAAKITAYDPKFWTGYASRCEPAEFGKVLIAPDAHIAERVKLRLGMIGLDHIKIRAEGPEATR